MSFFLHISLCIHSANIFTAETEYWRDGDQPNRINYCPFRTYIPMAITDKQTKLQGTYCIEK